MTLPVCSVTSAISPSNANTMCQPESGQLSYSSHRVASGRDDGDVMTLSLLWSSGGFKACVMVFRCLASLEEPTHPSLRKLVTTDSLSLSLSLSETFGSGLVDVMLV